MINPIETQSSVFRFSDLEKQTWREIFTLMDVRLVKDKLKRNAKAKSQSLTDDFATQKSNDIQYCIRQAKDYFQSSKYATVLTKPTLIYYGLISLASALVIFKQRDKSLNSMKESHGLKDKYPINLSNIGKQIISRAEILNISAEIQDSGAFIEIFKMDLSEYFNLPIKNESSQDTSKDFQQIINMSANYPNLSEVTLLSLFQNIPEIWKETKLTLKKESLVYSGEAILNNDTIVCRISKELAEISELKNNLTFTENAAFQESNNYYFFSLPRNKYTENTPLTKRDILGVQYLNADKNNPLVGSDFVIYYLLFFIFGSLSRYKPALWRTILEDPLHGLNTIPEILCESACVKIPFYFLSEFNNNFYKL